MKTSALLAFTVLLVLCHFATVTLGGPTNARQIEEEESNQPLLGHYPTNARQIVEKESNQPLLNFFQKKPMELKSHDLTKSFEDLNFHLKDAEACFERAVGFYHRTKLTPSAFVRCFESKTSNTYSFISIPDLNGEKHIYVVQEATELGRGVFGVVYLAKNIKIPDKFVAIKVTRIRSELKGLELVGELLGSVEEAGSWIPKFFIVMPFVPGVTLFQLAEMTYNGRRMYQYWMDENNKGYHTLLYRIAHDIVAPLMNKFLVHSDLHGANMMVAQIDENFLPAETDPATGLQHFRAIDFGYHHKILEREDILRHIHKVVEKVLFALPHTPFYSKFRILKEYRKTTMETFQKNVLDALDKDKFDIKIENGMPVSARRRPMSEYYDLLAKRTRREYDLLARRTRREYDLLARRTIEDSIGIRWMMSTYTDNYSPVVLEITSPELLDLC